MALSLPRILLAIFFLASCASAVMTPPDGEDPTMARYYTINLHTFDPYVAKQKQREFPIFWRFWRDWRDRRAIGIIVVTFDKTRNVFNVNFQGDEPILQGVLDEYKKSHIEANGIRFQFGLFKASKNYRDPYLWNIVIPVDEKLKKNPSIPKYYEKVFGHVKRVQNDGLFFDTSSVVPVGTFYRIYGDVKFVDEEGHVIG